MSDRKIFLERHRCSQDLLDDLDKYSELLVKWQRSFNLVGPKTISELWVRHFSDSLQILNHAPTARHWVDLGSGAGFPGMVIALALKEAGGRVDLVESNSKKASFLQTVSRETSACTKVHRDRLENVLPNLVGKPDVVTARALAPLKDLLFWCEGLLKTGAIGLFHKGKDLDKELEEASKYWLIKYELLPSVVASDSHLIRVSELSRIAKS